MPLDYDMPLYRPPSEGRNLIIQATLGCSANNCTFCSMYKTKDYIARPLQQVFADIEAAATVWPQAGRIFLADGDAMTLPMESLRAILDKLAATFPNLSRVSAYATPKNLIDKTHEELVELKGRKLTLVYIGLESGSTNVLKRVIKGASQKTLEMALTKANKAGLKTSATVILGLAGKTAWEDHIAGTAELVNRQPPTYLSTLQLTLEPDEYAGFMDRQEDSFELQDDMGILDEQERLISLLNPPKPVIFRSNHASNCLPLAGNLPKDNAKLLEQISLAKYQSGILCPAFQRGF
ncbi:MAG: radical SAM protein [Rhodospirillales bacterium]|nr:radical SAM protein [Rhodospirillales bacterium]